MKIPWKYQSYAPKCQVNFLDKKIVSLVAEDDWCKYKSICRENDKYHLRIPHQLLWYKIKKEIIHFYSIHHQMIFFQIRSGYLGYLPSFLFGVFLAMIFNKFSSLHSNFKSHLNTYFYLEFSKRYMWTKYCFLMGCRKYILYILYTSQMFP